MTPLASAGLDAYNPPGHGSVYFDLYYPGILKQLKDTGIDYLFISNADNLAATVDPNIVQHLAQSKCPFLIELTPKTNNDRKGGTVVIHNNQLTLWEVAQVQSEQQSLFESQPYFNTNNLWVSVSALINVIEQNTLTLDLIKNPKNHHDQSSFKWNMPWDLQFSLLKGAGHGCSTNQFFQSSAPVICCYC